MALRVDAASDGSRREPEDLLTGSDPGHVHPSRTGTANPQPAGSKGVHTFLMGSDPGSAPAAPAGHAAERPRGAGPEDQPRQHPVLAHARIIRDRASRHKRARTVSVGAWHRFASARPKFRPARAPRRPSGCFASEVLRLRDRLRGRLLDGLRRGPRRSASLRARRGSSSPSTRRSPGSWATSSATRSSAWPSGCSITRPGSRSPRAPKLVVFHPGFLLGRTREDRDLAPCRAARRAARRGSRARAASCRSGSR